MRDEEADLARREVDEQAVAARGAVRLVAESLGPTVDCEFVSLTSDPHDDSVRPGPLRLARPRRPIAGFALIIALVLSGCYQSHQLREGWEGGVSPPCAVGVWDCARVMNSCGDNGLPPVVGPSCTAHTYVVFYATGLVEWVPVLRRDDLGMGGLLGNRRWAGFWSIEDDRVVMTNGFGSPTPWHEELPLSACEGDEFDGLVAATWALHTVGGVDIDPCVRADARMERALLRLAGQREIGTEVFFEY